MPRQKKQFALNFSAHEKGLPFYNGLLDPNLYGFFTGKQKKRLLVRQNLVYIT